MALKERIEGDIKKAMLAKDKDRLRALRAIKASILLVETEKGTNGAISEDKEISILMKAVKQRKESADIYTQQGRPELAKGEMDELAIIEEYLPKQLSEEELKEKLSEIIKRIGASTPKDMGKVMGVATKELAGTADGKMVSTIVKQLLT